LTWARSAGGLIPAGHFSSGYSTARGAA
jgi:hypothetical protein